MKIIRVIPATIVVAGLFLTVKLIDVVRGSENIFISKVEAQQAGEGKDAPQKAEPKPAETEEKKGDAPAVPRTKEEAKMMQKSSKEKDKEEKKDKEKEGEKKEEGKDKNENPAVSKDAGPLTDRHFTAVELDVLQNLSKRREEMDRWERNIQIKEEALNATEKRINDKIQQIDDMKKDVAALLAQYNAQEDAKIKSLVKIYEAMKPKDAARIFDEVEMPILLLVIDKMAEKKAAPILAEMNPKKAKQITVELAEQRRLSPKPTAAPTPIAAAKP